VHDSFEWNVSADLSVLFSTAGHEEDTLSHLRQDRTLIVALVDKANSNDRNVDISRPNSCAKNFAQELEGIVVGVLELSREQLVSCGVAGRWCPLMTHLKSNDQRGHGRLGDAFEHTGQGAVGEALVAFAWMQKGPAMDTLPTGRTRYNRVDKCRKRPREKYTEENDIDGLQRGISKKRAAAEINAATSADIVNRPFVEYGDGIEDNLVQQEILVCIHVWDALVPRDRPRSALYLTLRLSCPGLRAQRVSTKPARGRGGLRMNTTSAGGSAVCSLRASTQIAARRRSRAEFMHVVWDEHLSLSVKSPVGEGAVVELLLRDASVDDDTTIAAREGEPFRTFAERNRPAWEGATPDLMKSTCSSTSCHLQIPGPTVYRLRLHEPPGDVEDGNEQYSAPSNAEYFGQTGREFGGVEVRMTGLVVEGYSNAVDHDADAVKHFLQRRADVARTPGGGERRLSTVGGDGGTSSFIDSTRLPTQAKRRSGRRSRLLDLSAASGLFHQFADDEQGESSVAIVKDAARSSPEAALGEAETEWFQETEKSVLLQRHEPSCSTPTLSKESLRLIVQQCFPQLLKKMDCESVHVVTSQLATDDHRSAGTARSCSESSNDLSFADFVSWLRSIPQVDLGTAGLLVTPRTAILQTENVMIQDADLAQELAATLEIARQPMATWVGDWFSLSLRSTEDAVALDRVRLGWGRAGRKGGQVDEATERAGRRHAKLLRRDVAVLGKVLTELEGRCARDTTTRKGRADTNGALESSSKEGRGVAIVMDGGTEEADGETPSFPTNELQGHREVPKASHTQTIKNYASLARGRGLAAQGEPGKCSIVALCIGQEAARLGLAAEHLKEALRCAADGLNLDTAHYLDDQLASHGYPCAQSGMEKRWFGDGHGASIQTLLVAGNRNDWDPDGPPGSVRRRHYGLLLQHIKQVGCLQAEISEFQRRAGVLARRRGDQAKALAEGGQGCVCRHGSESSSFEIADAPRSPLALVKRIRRAQNAARRQASLGSPSAASGVGAASEDRETASCDQGYTGLPEATDDCGSVCGSGDARMDWQLPQDNAPSPPLCNEPPVAVSGYVEGVATCVSSPAKIFDSPRTVFDKMLRRPPSLQKVQERLERVRITFRERAIDLPAAFSGATAGQILNMARGGVKGGWEANPKTLAPAASLCCPIDRFALHIFRTAGAANEGGITVYADVQELTSIGGLDTHSSEESLWAAAAQAGIVDIERWVVAAVLRQATDAMEFANDWGASNGPQARPRVTEKRVTVAADMGGASSVVEAAPRRDVVLAEATSLWEELRDKAFQSVLVASSRSAGQDALSIPELYLSSSEAVGIWLTPSEESLQANRVDFAGRAAKDEVAHVGQEDSIERLYRQRYSALSSSPGCFDRALMRTLVLAGRGKAKPTLASVGPRKMETAVLESVESDRVDDVLLHNFVIAGFADGSRLKLSDIVNAVIVRRQRSVLGVSAGRCLGSIFTEKKSHSEVEPDKNRSRPEGGPTPTGKSGGDARRKISLTAEAKIVDSGDGQLRTERLIETAAGSVSTGVGIDSRYLVGIPAELRELFRAAGLAAAVRKKKQWQRKKKQLEEFRRGSAEDDELGVAEQTVSRILDSDRTLESAPFSGGKTALHHAAARGDDFLVRLLLARGCKADLKDFEGKRSCDLTRDLECLRLLGTLKKAVRPSALSMRRIKPGEVVTANGEAEQCDIAAVARSSARAMVDIQFSVSFRRLKADQTAGPTSDGVATSIGSTETADRSSPGYGKEGRTAAPSEDGKETLVEGVARSYDVRNKVLYIGEVGASSIMSSAIGAAAGSTASGSRSAHHENEGESSPDKLASEECSKGRRIGEDQCNRCSARHVLDVELLACLCPQGDELFKQLQVFSCAFKAGLARASLDLAVDAAADLGASYRLVLDTLVVDILKGEVALEAYREEKLAAAVEVAAISVVAAVLRAAQRAIVARSGPGRDRAKRRRLGSAAAAGKDVETGMEKLRLARVSSSIMIPDQGFGRAVNSDTGTKRRDCALVVDKSIAARMRFYCTTIVREKRRKAPGHAEEKALPGNGRQAANGTSSDVIRRDGTRYDVQYLAKWSVEDGISTVVVSGRSYLDAVASEKKTGAGDKPINLEGGDADMQRVLDHHGVTLSACVQTFDLMQARNGSMRH
ncbi:unnamed protein product, partial [Hapterophycus canaliculatus]